MKRVLTGLTRHPRVSAMSKGAVPPLPKSRSERMAATSPSARGVLRSWRQSFHVGCGAASEAFLRARNRSRRRPWSGSREVTCSKRRGGEPADKGLALSRSNRQPARFGNNSRLMAAWPSERAPMGCCRPARAGGGASAIPGLPPPPLPSLLLTKATETQLGNQSCSPAPCGDDGSGFEVYVDSINRNLQPNDQFSSPEPGNHFVLVTVHFKNNANGEQSANPLNFVLQDPAGVKHALTLSGGSQCPVFSAVNLTKGSTLGPKAMCFEAGGDPKGKLTLVWTPGLHDVDIDLSSAKPA